MWNFIFGGVIGLIIGWNFLKQPQWMANLVGKFTGWVKGLFSGKKS